MPLRSTRYDQRSLSSLPQRNVERGRGLTCRSQTLVSVACAAGVRSIAGVETTTDRAAFRSAGPLKAADLSVAVSESPGIGLSALRNADLAALVTVRDPLAHVGKVGEVGVVGFRCGGHVHIVDALVSGVNKVDKANLAVRTAGRSETIGLASSVRLTLSATLHVRRHHVSRIARQRLP